MIEPFPFAGLPLAVFGLGRSGLSAARALAAADAEVWAWDDDEGQREKAEEAGVPLVDLYHCDWRELTTLVLSPGVPLTHPEPHPIVGLARAAGCEVIGDVELLARTMRDARYIGITGTNGKSTTTALVGHILSLAGRSVEVGGNLGMPVLALDPLDGSGTYVIEMSSYQLDLTVSITFDVAALLNLTPDHIDRHGSFDDYVAVKKKIFHRQTDPRTAVVCVDDEPCRRVFDALVAQGDQRLIPVAVERAVEGGVYVLDGVLHDDTEGHAAQVIDLKPIAALPGAHNWQNAAAAFAVARAASVAPPVAGACLRSFPGLAHRMELVAVIDGVRYVNDSKATNADAAARALACYDAIYWIAGGRAKEGGIAALAPHFPSIARAFLIGEAAGDFAATLADRVPHTLCGDLATAVSKAAAAATGEGRDDAVVLLSPACASFDQFADFEARGDAFRALVAGLSGAREDLDDLAAGAFPGGGVH
ncbi:MAG: UDP-N-acetylmuramoyl-L-alanine--D-glutamate ligase [Alphaproteobacteria bacterium]